MAGISSSNGSSSSASHDHLNAKLNTEYLDIDPSDSSCNAKCTRCVASCVGVLCTPHRMLTLMRILKAVTFSFLLLTIAADALYIFFVDFMSGVGDDGLRGMTVRFYGLGLAILAIMIELDVKSAVTLFPGFKGFIPRALLLLLIAVITNVTYQSTKKDSTTGSSSTNGINRFLAEYYEQLNDNEDADNDNSSNNYSNDNSYYASTSSTSNSYVLDDDDIASQYFYTPTQIENVPMSAVIFQMVTSWVLAGCALVYFIMGLFCCDRFTAKAFVTSHDRIASTVIGSSTAAFNTESDGQYKAPTSARSGYFA